MRSELSKMIIERVYSVTTMYTEENTTVKRTARPCWAVLIKYEGETVYSSGEKKYISNINNMVILPKGSDYEWQCTKAGHFAIIEFKCDLALNNIYSFPIANGEKMLKTFKNLEYKRLTKQPFYELESIKDTYDIILKLLETLENKYTPSAKAQKLAVAMEYISKNYTKEIRNDILANMTGLSTVYFRKLFSEVYGTSPINFIKELRMKKAKEMLRSDYSSITDIALSLGYPNIFDFSRDFKKHVGVAPSKYIG